MSLPLDEVLAALPKRLRKVFEDPSVTELMINSPDSVWFEKEGCLYPVYTGKEPKSEVFTERMIDTFVKRVARPLGFDADRKSPIVDARLPDGSRVAIACPPITESFALSIRRFGSRPWTAAKLVETGSIPAEVLSLISTALSQRENVIISGGTGTGKTTMLSAFASLINEEERIVCIEDTRELHIPAPNCLRLESKISRKDEEGPNVTIRDLVRHALRHRPDRLIVGEIRGEEAQDLLEALNTGHGGSISTVHANSARAALTRLATCALQSDAAPPWDVICEHVALAVQYVIHLQRSLVGRRGVRQVLQVNSYDRNQQDYDYSIVWEAPPMDANGDSAARRIMDQALNPLASTRLCAECSAELPSSGKGSKSPLCKACRRKQQNHASYLRRKAKAQDQTAGNGRPSTAAPRGRGKPRSRIRES
ncbi:MAG: ATPase, T2SS/T4P/T4SS family [Bryobacterales bacterium]|nr:ATPase, T2SS/T4P/T4SS family [Bryobacterales bacterium]MDE0293016.1 ATPase, T2SS/T4P/T4SS family [Bryobacterales bacterium]